MPTKEDKKIHENIITISENDDEELCLRTEFFDEKENDDVYLVQELTYFGPTAITSMVLFGNVLTPEALREMADVLEKELKVAITKKETAKKPKKKSPQFNN